jgi:hypothetical protein
MPKSVKDYRYKHTSVFILGLIVAFLFSRFENFHGYILAFGEMGYLGVFLLGILYDFTFSAATSVVLLLVFAEKLVLWKILLIATLGSVVGDIFLFKYLKSNLVSEIKHLVNRFGLIDKIHHTGKKSIKFAFTVLGIIIIMTPLPDELGIGLLGMSDISLPQFTVISFILNLVGLYIILQTSAFIKP